MQASADALSRAGLAEVVKAGTEITPARRLCAEFEVNGIDAVIDQIRIDGLVNAGFARAGFMVNRDRNGEKTSSAGSMQAGNRSLGCPVPAARSLDSALRGAFI